MRGVCQAQVRALGSLGLYREGVPLLLAHMFPWSVKMHCKARTDLTRAQVLTSQEEQRQIPGRVCLSVFVYLPAFFSSPVASLSVSLTLKIAGSACIAKPLRALPLR